MGAEVVGTIGLILLALGGAVILVELALVLPRLIRLRKKVEDLRWLATQETGMVRSQVARLQYLRFEIDRSLRPFRQLQRIYTHPLTEAVLASLLRRRRP